MEEYLTEYNCQHCGHIWISKWNGSPTDKDCKDKCPRCGSKPSWNPPAKADIEMSDLLRFGLGNHALLPDTEDSDYILNKDFRSAWVTVDNLSVYISRTDEGVVVDLYPHGDENNDPLGSTYAFFSDVKPQVNPQ